MLTKKKVIFVINMQKFITSNIRQLQIKKIIILVYTIQNGAYERNGLSAYSVGDHDMVLNWMMEITDLLNLGQIMHHEK